MTEFQQEHPGGKAVLAKVAGQDASKQFAQFHNAAIMNKYHERLNIGSVVKMQSTTEVTAIQTPAIAPMVAKSEVITPHVEKAVVLAASSMEEEEEYEGLKQGDTFGELVPYGDPYWYQDWVF